MSRVRKAQIPPGHLDRARKRKSSSGSAPISGVREQIFVRIGVQQTPTVYSFIGPNRHLAPLGDVPIAPLEWTFHCGEKLNFRLLKFIQRICIPASTSTRRQTLVGVCLPTGTVCLGTLLGLCRFNFANSWRDSSNCFFGSFSAKMFILGWWQLERQLGVSSWDQLAGCELVLPTLSRYHLPMVLWNVTCVSANRQLVPLSWTLFECNEFLVWESLGGPHRLNLCG
jgi:hypothetical protein